MKKVSFCVGLRFGHREVVFGRKYDGWFAGRVQLSGEWQIGVLVEFWRS